MSRKIDQRLRKSAANPSTMAYVMILMTKIHIGKGYLI